MQSLSRSLPDEAATLAAGEAIAALLASQSPASLRLHVDLLGDLGAGKTTLTQGLGEGLGVEGPVISPTFVLARVHRSLVAGPALVHADAYRLGGFAELEDLDLEVSLDDSVTLVEWGSGIAEGLSDQHLEIDIRRSLDPDDEARAVFLTPIGARWEAVRADLESLR